MLDPKLVDHLKNEATILTPNRRLAGRIKQEANAYFAQTQTVWFTPPIISLSDWLQRYWNQYEMQGAVEQLLLNLDQALLQWEKIIRESPVGQTLLRPALTAKTALQAWQRLHEWLAVEDALALNDNIDQRVFSEWVAAYQEWLLQNQFLDRAQLPEKLLSLLLLPSKQGSRSCVLYGFAEMTPREVAFFNTLRDTGWQIFEVHPTPLQPTKILRLPFADQEQEWLACAKWCQNLLNAHKNNIAVVVPYLTKSRFAIEIIFKNVLDPFAICEPAVKANPYFNISAGLTLSGYPLIQGAVQILKLCLNKLPIAEYAVLLKSPFIAQSTEEQLSRARLAAELRTIPLTHWGLVQNNQQKLVHWDEVLRALQTARQSCKKVQTFNQWAKHIRELLALAGWPGDRPLSSFEYQTLQRWESFLEEFAQFDTIAKPVDFVSAVNILLPAIARLIFQPEDKGAPIQILGLLEAIGQHYDHLWVMGLHSEAWPPSPTPNPFIGLEMQRRLKMPHASPEKEMEYAQKVTASLKESAAEIIFSYPTQEKEKILTVSQLIVDLPVGDGLLQGIGSAENRCEDFFSEPISLEKIIDEQAPVLEDTEQVNCNAKLLELQAVCPFKAFAQLRLKAIELVWEDKWLGAAQQGTIIHKILENFWQVFSDQAQLLNQTAGQREEKLTHIIANVIQQAVPPMMPAYYIEVEKTRLKIILLEYIALEAKRPPFKVVFREQKGEYKLGAMHFRLRYDRIDQDAQGNYYLLDYKTGFVNLADLWGDRIKAPQLPLYYLAAQNLPPQALVIAKINRQNCEFEGIEQVATEIPGVKLLTQIRHKHLSDLAWQDLNAYWHKQLSQTAFAFKNGEAKPDPLNGAATCQYCQLSSFCRIQERESL